MTTGMIMPSSLAVLALNALQKSIMFTPCWPRAGPIGGEGLALPASTCNLICVIIFYEFPKY